MRALTANHLRHLHCRRGRPGARIARRPGCDRTTACAYQGLVEFEGDDVVTERQIGSLSLIRVSTTGAARDGNDTPQSGGAGMGPSTSRQSYDDVGVTARLYTGEIIEGIYAGRKVILKEYPVGGVTEGTNKDVDLLATNEIITHSFLQEMNDGGNVSLLLGGFEGCLEEKWLVFESDGIFTSSVWADIAAKTNTPGKKRRTLFQLLDPELEMHRRQAFILKVLVESLKGLAFMHEHNIIHQSISPNSIVLTTLDEKELSSLSVKLRDLSFAVDVSESALRGGGTLAELWEAGNSEKSLNAMRQGLASELWRRAAESGCATYFQQRNFGVSDDIYQLGMSFLYIILVSLSEVGSIDAATLHRYVEVTFPGDIKKSFRNFINGDQRFEQAVIWLDETDGWDLLDSMLQTEWRQRPTAESCLKHPFMKQKVMY